MTHSKLKSQELIDQHIVFISLELPAEIDEYLADKNYYDLDRWAQKAIAPEGLIHSALKNLLDFKFIESIIAIRSGGEDEEGIWHDDGSRILGFSLSLTQDHLLVQGGHLEFRQKGQTEFQSIPTQKKGTLICFKTGVYGYEHRVSKVDTGVRIVIAGWCYE
jgi:hypothetical protein